MENKELRELIGDLHTRQMAASIAIKALLRASPQACDMLRRYADAGMSADGALATDEQQALGLQLRALLPSS